MRVFFFLFIFTNAFNAVAAAPSCRNVFQNETSRNDSRTLTPNFGISYQKSEQVQGFKNRTGYLRTFTHYHETLDGKMIRTDLFDFFPSQQKGKGSNKYLHLVAKNIQFVLGQYSQRRGWTPEYLKAIREDAIAFAERSTYIVAHRQKIPVLDAPGEIIGTMKVISGDKENPLPFEIDHQIKVPLNNGKKFEPGNFVVLKEESALAFGEVMSHFVRFSKELQKEPGHRPDQMIFFTDADRASAMMYRQLGFSTVPGFEKALIKDGKEYYLIGASTQAILQFPKVFESKRTEWEKDGALEFFTRTPGRMPLEEFTMVFKNLDIKTSGDHQYTANQLKTLRQNGLQLYFTKSSKLGQDLTLRRDYGIGKMYFNIELKNSELPLREGLIRARDEKNGENFEITYSQGVLQIHFKNRHDEVRIGIETTSDFSDVRAVQYEVRNAGELDLRITTQAVPDIRSFP